MSDITALLAWFEGYVENVKKQPTPEQWSRIKAWAADLKVAAASIPAGEGMPSPQAMTPAPTERMKKPTNDREWKAQYMGALIDMGVDMDSAKEFAATADVDLNRSPKDAARSDAGGLLN